MSAAPASDPSMRSGPRRAGRLPALLIALAIVLLVGAAAVFAAGRQGGDGAAVAVPAARASRPTVDGFDEASAWSLLREQVALGPRPAGSAASASLTRRMAARLPGGRVETERAADGTLLRNVVGRIPGTRPAIVIAAHHDTKAGIDGFVGADDGASGVAVVVELARALRRTHRAQGAAEIRFVLLDGEENPDDAVDFLTGGVRGSRAYLARHPGTTRAFVLLDMVGDRDLEIPREAGSDPAIWARLRASARRVGTQAAFPAATRAEVLDDHTPFVRAGIPSVDLIDFTFSCWHRRCDDLGAVSARSLDRVGETVLDMLQRWPVDRRAPYTGAR